MTEAELLEQHPAVVVVGSFGELGQAAADG